MAEVGMLAVLLLLGGILVVGILLWAVKVSTDANMRSKHLADRLERIEQMLAAGGLAARPVPPPVAAAPVAPPAAPLLPLVVSPPPAPLPPAPKPQPSMSVSQVEEWIGSVWLQNAGSVLVLVGVFFLILWGYSTGRLGPEALVGAGAVMGLGFLWRGDRVSRTMPAFGHALIGIGLGIVYLSLYVGHVQLDVLPRAVALVLLVLVSIASILCGLRYRVEAIAVLGVIGAFVPPLLGAWTCSGAS